MRNSRIHIAPRLVLAGLALLSMLLLSAPAAFASEGCPNEAVREESRVNPATSQPYSTGLPECRAYEMVSPLDKQAHDATPAVIERSIIAGPDGLAGWTSEGAFAEPKNYRVGDGVENPYVSTREPSGWTTLNALQPASLIEIANPIAFGVDLAPDFSREATCALSSIFNTSIVCALREPDGAWLGTPPYSAVTRREITGQSTFNLGMSVTGTHIFFQPPSNVALLPSDTLGLSAVAECPSVYEVSGLETGSPSLSLVTVDSEGKPIGVMGHEKFPGLGAGCVGAGDEYQAISESGETVYFTALPTSTGVPTLYARIDGGTPAAHTVDISNPAEEGAGECTRTEPEPVCNAPARAIFQGASADGSKVFFLTSQQLVNGDTDEGQDLYEYDFNNPPGKKLVQVSGGGLGDLTPGTGAEVGGVVRGSKDGSHIYFTAEGVLTTLPNGLGQAAAQGAANLYGYDTDTGETKFVAELSSGDGALTESTEEAGFPVHGDGKRPAQTTPDGRYLVFATYSRLITSGPEADTSGAQQVYRYDFETGGLVRVSVGERSFAASQNGNTPGMDSTIAAPSWGARESDVSANNRARAISSDGSTIIFETPQQLQADDVNTDPSTSSCNVGQAGSAGCDVYEWHECTGVCADGMHGVVGMVSDGQDPAGVDLTPGGVLSAPSMSPSGEDIYFATHTRLVGQDTDELQDIYDARVNGGFPAPTPEPSCSGEACQGSSSSSPAFGASGTSSLTAGGNLTPGSTSFTTPQEPKPKPLTQAQKLAKALKQCKKDKAKKKRLACEKEARKKYGKTIKKKK